MRWSLVRESVEVERLQAEIRVVQLQLREIKEGLNSQPTHAEPVYTTEERILSEAHLSGLREAYRQHTGAFRAWLVAFGVAVPVFLASNEDIWAAFSQAGNRACIAYLFLSGVAIQVLLALADKYADLFCLTVVMGWRDKSAQSAKLGVWWIENDWPSIAGDVVSLGFFLWAFLAITHIALA